MHRYLENNAPKNHSAGIISSNLSRDYDYPKDESGGEVNNNGYGGSDGKSLGTDRRTQTGGNFGSGLEGKAGGNGASAGDEHNSMESAASVGDKGAAYALRGFENSGREDDGNLANLANLGNKASSAAASIGESMGLGGYNGQESGSIDSKSGFGNDGDQRGFGANRGEGEGFKGGMNRSGEGNTGAMDIGKQADEAQKNNQDAFGLGANTEKDMQGSGKGTNDGDFLREEASGQGIGEIGADQRSGLAESFGGDLGAMNGGLGAGLEGKPLAEKNVMTGNMGEGAVGQAGLAAGLGNGPAGGGFGGLATGSRSGQAGGLRRKGAKPEKKLGESAAENAKLAAEAGEKKGEKNRENSAKPFGPFTGDAKNFGGTPSLADGFGNGAGSGYNVNKGEGLTGGAGDGSGRGNGGAGGPYSKSKPGSGYGGYGGGPGEFGPNLQGGGFPRSGGIKQGGKGDDPVGQKGIQNALDDEDNDPSAQKALQNLENGSGTPEQAKEKAPSKKKLPPKLRNLLKKLNDAFNNPKPKPKKSEKETPSTPQKKWPTFPFKEEKSPIDALQEAEEELENEIKEQNIQPDEQETEEELAKEKEEELAKEEEKAQENAIKNTETPEGRAENSNNPIGAAANAQTPEGAEENTKTPEGRAANANTPEGAAANAQTPDGQKANTQTPEGRAANSSMPGGATENSKFPEGQQANLSTPEGVEANSHIPGGAEANTQTPEGRKANTKTPEGRAANATTPEGAAANAETADGQKENAQTPEGRAANEKTPGGRAANEKMHEGRDVDKSEMAKAPQEKEELKDLMDDAKAEKALNDEIADKIGDEAEANALENGAPAEEAKKIGDEEAEKARKDFDKNLDDKLKDKIAEDANKNKFTDPEAEKAIKRFLKGKKKREEEMPQSENEEENLAKDIGKGAKQDAGDENLSDQFAEPEEDMEEMSDDEEEPEKYMEGLGESEEQGKDGADAGEQKAEKQAAVLKAMKNGKNTIDAQLEGIKSDLKNEALKPLEKKEKEEDQIEDDIVRKLPPNTENLPILNGFTKLPLKNKKIPKPVSEDDKEKNKKNQKLKNLLGNAITRNQHKDSPLDSIITDDGVYNLPDNAKNLEIDSGFIFYPEKEGEELKKDDKCKSKLNSFKNMGEFPDYPLGAVLYILKFFKKKIDLRKNNSSNSDECFKPEKGIGLQINKGNVKLEPWDSFSKKIRPSVLEEDVPKEKEILPKKEKPKIKSKVFKTLSGKKYLEVTPPLGPSHTIELNDDGEIKFDKDDFKEIMDAENDVNLNILKTNKPLEKDSPKENAFEENTMSKIKKRKKDPLKLISPRNSFNSKFNPKKLFAAKKKPDIKRVYIKVVKNPQNQIKFTKIFVKNPKNKKSSVKIIGAQESPKIQLEPTKLVKPVEEKEPPKIVRKIRKPLPQISKTVIKQPIVDVSPKENYIIKSEGEKKIRKPTTQMSKTITKQPIVKVLPKENYIMKRKVLKRKNKNKPIRIINPQKNKIDNPQPKEKEKEKEKQEVNPSKVINN